jgi:hypothetical protein
VRWCALGCSASSAPGADQPNRHGRNHRKHLRSEGISALPQAGGGSGRLGAATKCRWRESNPPDPGWGPGTSPRRSHLQVESSQCDTVQYSADGGSRTRPVRGGAAAPHQRGVVCMGREGGGEETSRGSWIRTSTMAAFRTRRPTRLVHTPRIPVRSAGFEPTRSTFGRWWPSSWPTSAQKQRHQTDEAPGRGSDPGASSDRCEQSVIASRAGRPDPGPARPCAGARLGSRCGRVRASCKTLSTVSGSVKQKIRRSRPGHDSSPRPGRAAAIA